MLGIAVESVVHSRTVTIGPGDSLVLHTDGITEALVDAANRQTGGSPTDDIGVVVVRCPI